MRRLRLPIALVSLTLALSPLAAQEAAPASRADALLLYRQGRDFETAGKAAEAQVKFTESVAICDQELALDPKRIEAYVVKA